MTEADTSIENTEAVAEKIAIGALKYQILKQGSGKNIVFDISQALSFEGDSGPYLQYTLARTNSLLAKAPKGKNTTYEETGEEIYKLLYQFEEVIERAGKEYAPQQLTTYLIELASRFNTYYAQEKIIDPENKERTAQKIAMVEAVHKTLRKGLTTLGIPVIERM